VSVHRLNVTLDGEHAEKLRRLAERTHVQEGTLARSLLSTALDEADPDARSVTELLDGIDGAFERSAARERTGFTGSDGSARRAVARGARRGQRGRGR
jgi:hypothetical protein